MLGSAGRYDCPGLLMPCSSRPLCCTALNNNNNNNNDNKTGRFIVICEEAASPICATPSPKKLPLGDLDSHLICRSLGHPIHYPKQHIHRVRRFSQNTQSLPTDRRARTYRTRNSTCTNWPLTVLRGLTILTIIYYYKRNACYSADN